MSSTIPVRASTSELLARYARRCAPSVEHAPLTVPVLGWLLGALVAPYATGARRTALSDALGTDPSDAARRALELLESGHPGLGLGLAVWGDPGQVTDAFHPLGAALPASVRGRIPALARAHAWLAQRSGGRNLLAESRLDAGLAGAPALALLGCVAPALSWLAPYRVCEHTFTGDFAGAPALHSHGWDLHELHLTDVAGLVAVHHAVAVAGITVTSVLGQLDTTRAELVAAALEVATGRSERMGPRPDGAARTAGASEASSGESDAPGEEAELREPAEWDEALLATARPWTGGHGADVARFPAFTLEASGCLTGMPGIPEALEVLAEMLPPDAVLAVLDASGVSFTAAGRPPLAPTIAGPVHRITLEHTDPNADPNADQGTDRHAHQPTGTALCLEFDRPYAVVLTSSPTLRDTLPLQRAATQPAPHWDGVVLAVGWVDPATVTGERPAEEHYPTATVSPR